MRIRVLPVLLILALTGFFALINWSSFTVPTSLNLGLAIVTAPLGLVMLGVVALLALMYVASVVYLQGSALLEARRMAKELQTQRELADKAEASRLTEMREFTALELQRTQKAQDDRRIALLARLDQMEARMRAMTEDASNSLSAYIGEFEDRFDRRLSTFPLPIPGDYPQAPR
jgi:hypothetical protein